MTMKRSEKRDAMANLKPEADGYTEVQFAHPRLRAEARAERGHMRMTPAEVAALRLGRGAMPASRIEDTRRRKAETRVGQRVTGTGRRIKPQH